MPEATGFSKTPEHETPTKRATSRKRKPNTKREGLRKRAASTTRGGNDDNNVNHVQDPKMDTRGTLNQGEADSNAEA